MHAYNSADYNPIERGFFQYKQKLRRQSYNADRGQSHLNALLSVTADNVRNYYRSLGFFGYVPLELQCSEDDEEDNMLLAAAMVVVSKN